uniref:ATP synthase complex subunit 8 n=1 Tax=Acizzia uncatoides TaxID=121830 RepID=A0A344A226_ACIUN|nr:ATP synthase F0 subunit 8 [Acizzia uncatoides]AWU48817.1 ATP synthase F0 subunit 8 [Acizzia uncatoides]
MPQMAPLPWVTLMILTLFTLFLVSSMIYFNIPMKIKISTKPNSINFPIKW